MMKSAGAWVAAVMGAALLTACTTEPETEATPSPTNTDAGSIDLSIEQSATPEPEGSEPTPSPTASVAPPVSDNPSADPSPPADSHDIFDEEMVSEDFADAACTDVAKWWSSAGDVSMDEWLAEGSGFYITPDAASKYNETAYSALASDDWNVGEFDVFATPLLAPGNFGCILIRPDAEVSRDEGEAVTFTFTNDEPLIPAAMTHSPRTNLSQAQDRMLENYER